MASAVSEELRRLVEARAERLCEYCLIHEDDTFFGCEVDHIISQKHGGPTESDNLAFACFVCNRHKGSDIGSVLVRSGELVRFFNPRRDRWGDHFRLEGGLVMPRTDIAEATLRILRFNDPERVLERETLMALGRYPPANAAARMEST